MAVERIEQYRQQNGVDILKVILKSTKRFPDGYFYAPAEAVDLVNNRTWFLSAIDKNRVCVISNSSNYHHSTIYFYRELFEFYNGYTWQDVIDHVNLVEIDNTEDNLNPVTQQQNSFNKVSRGYEIDTRFNPFVFQVQISHNRLFQTVRNEVDACRLQYDAEHIWLRDKLGTQYYMFDFKKYRRGSEDILDLERTGQISEEEATYKHILRYADNAWYMLRYGLEQYFKDNHIPIPSYRVDDMGFMIHPITGQKLCPF